MEWYAHLLRNVGAHCPREGRYEYECGEQEHLCLHQGEGRRRKEEDGNECERKKDRDILDLVQDSYHTR